MSICERASVSVVSVGCLFIQMTQIVSVRGHGHDRSKVPLSSARCDRWEQNLMWKDRDLRGKITITRITAGGETDILPLI